MQRSKVVTLVAVLAVLAWAVIGFLPWLASGLQVSLLAGAMGGSAEGTTGLVMPLPLVAGALPELVACGIIGGTIAGLVPIAVTHVSRVVIVLEVWFVVLGTVLVAWLVCVRRLRDAAPGLFASDWRVLCGLGGALVAAVSLGLLLSTIAVRWHGFTAVPAALVAGCMRTWVAAFVPPGRLEPHTVSWISAVLLTLVMTAGLVVSVRRSRAAILGWPVALAVLWATGPALVAVSYLTALLRPSSGLPATLGEHLSAARQVFGQAIGHTHPSLVAVVVAVAVGAAAAVHWQRIAASASASQAQTRAADDGTGSLQP